MERVASGVDMSKASFVGAVWVTGRALALGKFANDASGFAALQQALLQQQAEQGAGQIHLVVEPTGGYELGLVAFAYEQGWLVSLPRPGGTRQPSA
jgi:transposase